MSNLFATLRSSAGTLDTIQKALEITQNNVANASTPGYARQSMTPVARAFDPDSGGSGGVSSGRTESARSLLAERNVRRWLSDQGKSHAATELLEGVESAVPLSGGIPGALNSLLSSFSSWSLAPSDASARLSVVEGARTLAQTFRDTAANLSETSHMTDRQLGETVHNINELAGNLRDLNVQIRNGAQHDAGIDAQVNATLEQLSELVGFTAIKQDDGSITVLAGGAAALVIGDHQYDLRLDYSVAAGAAYPDGPPSARILDGSGTDVTGRITGGKLAGQLDVRDHVLPSLLGDTSQPGDLNRLAKALAERVNAIIAEGQTADGTSPSENLFTVDGNDTAVAHNLDVNTAFTPEMLGAAAPGPPYVSNGTALKLAALGTSRDPADTVDGTGFIDFYSGIASGTGRHLANARDAGTNNADMLAQAKSFREDAQGVSLDQEALSLMEYQRSYQACAQVVTTLNEITETLVNLLR